MEQPFADTSRRWDNVGTSLTGLVLGLGALGGLVGERFLSYGREAYADLGEESLPLITRMAMKLKAFHAFDALFLALLVFGIFLLITIKDRVRANLYGALAGIAMAFGGAILVLSALLPMMRIISLMGNQT